MSRESFMRVLPLLSLCTTGLVALVACNPPLPENEAPSIRLVSPEGDYNREIDERQYFADAAIDLNMTVLVRDRDGDEDLSLTVFLDSSPEDPADDGNREELIDFPVITADEELSFILDALEEGDQVIEMVASDGKEVNPTRTQRFAFQVDESLTPPVVEVTPTMPTSAEGIDGMTTTFATAPGGGDIYYEWQWSDGTRVVPDQPNQGSAGFLSAFETEVGDTWEFCVFAYRSDDNGVTAAPGAIPVQGCASATVI